MALSNIRKEPQREITESLVGILIVACILGLDYGICTYLNYRLSPNNPAPMLPAMMLVFGGLIVLLLAGWGILYGTHAVGEFVCGALANRGIELRPRDRK